MSATTIEVPADHVEAIRRSLAGRRGPVEGQEEVDSLLDQIGDSAAGDDGPRRLTGPRPLLWDAVYDSLCVAAEELVEDCNEYWRGVVEPDAARARVADVGTRLELLVGLGDPPGS